MNELKKDNNDKSFLEFYIEFKNFNKYLIDSQDNIKSDIKEIKDEIKVISENVIRHDEKINQIPTINARISTLEINDIENKNEIGYLRDNRKYNIGLWVALITTVGAIISSLIAVFER